EQLRAPVEQLGQRLLAVLGVELVLLFDRHPGQRQPLLVNLTVSLRLLGLEFRQLVSGRLPVLASSDRVLGHLIYLLLELLARSDTPKPISPPPRSTRTRRGGAARAACRGARRDPSACGRAGRSRASRTRGRATCCRTA